MKKSNLVIGIVQVLGGLLFTMSLDTDIQLGFAIVLLTMGAKNLFNLKQK